ncbi:25246_t:CDS:1, partial [Racocetra persica]
HGLPSDIILGMPWVVKTRCGFEWKDRKCYCTIQSDNGETMFVIWEEPIIDEYIVDKVCVKERNNNRRMNDVADMRS